MEEFFRQNVFATHAAAAASSVTFASCVTHPLDTLKSLHQVAAGSHQKLSLTQVLDSVKSAQGFSGLYGGVGWLTLGRLSGAGLRFGVYELLSAFCKDGREDNYVYVYEALLAGVAAGAAEATISTPFELLKLRSQMSSTSSKNICPSGVVQGVNPVTSKLLRGYTPDMKTWNQTLSLLSSLPNNNSNMIGALKRYPWLLTGSGKPPLASEVKSLTHVLSLEGWAVLARGLRSGITRDCIFGGVFFSTWQFFHTTMLHWKAMDMKPPPSLLGDVPPVSPLSASIAAGISGSLAAAASHCFDTAKTRSQCIVVPKYISMERKLLKWKKLGTGIEKFTGISPADRGKLLRGIWLRMARSGIGSFIIVGSYLFAVDQLV